MFWPARDTSSNKARLNVIEHLWRGWGGGADDSVTIC